MKKSFLSTICLVLCLFLWGCGESAGNTLTNNTNIGELPQEIIEVIAASEDGAYDVQVEESLIALSLKDDEL